MQRISTPFYTGSRTPSKRVAVTIAMVLVSGAMVWFGAAGMGKPSMAENQAATQASIDETTSNLRVRESEHIVLEGQLIMTRAEPAKVSREAAAFQTFKQEIALATQDLDNSGSGVHGLVERLTSVRSCLSLAFFMAKDFFTGGSEVDTIFLAEAEQLDRMTTNSVRDAKLAIDRLQAALQMTEGR